MGTGQAPDPFNMLYRVEALEKWKDTMEREGIAKTLAIFEERQAVETRRVDRLEEAMKPLLREADRSEGFWTKTKVLITVGLGTALVAGMFLLQLYALMQQGSA